MNIGPIRLGETVIALLDACELPTADLNTASSHGELTLFGAVMAGRLVGVIALEPAGRDLLVRSFGVRPACRGEAVGKRLLRHAERAAQARGVARLFLLTTTATGFFERHGYSEVARDDAPPANRASEQFSRICPGSAARLGKTL